MMKTTTTSRTCRLAGGSFAHVNASRREDARQHQMKLGAAAFYKGEEFIPSMPYGWGIGYRQAENGRM